MPFNLTAKMGREFDRLRTLTSLPTNLTCLKATSAGYTEIPGSPITAGWFCEQIKDSPDGATPGEQFLQILIAEGVWSTAIMDSLAAVVISSTRHKVNTILPPNGAPNVWLLKANPTGETV